MCRVKINGLAALNINFDVSTRITCEEIINTLLNPQRHLDLTF